MSHSHPRQFAFKRYEYAAKDGYHDYYGVVLNENMAQFPAGSRFEAASIRGDGDIHARASGRTYFLGNHGRSPLQSPRGRSQWSFHSEPRASTPSYQARSPRSPKGSSKWSFHTSSTGPKPASRSRYSACGSDRCGGM